MDLLPDLVLENLLSYIVISYSRIRDIPSLLLTNKRISSTVLGLNPQKLPILKANLLASRRKDADFLEYLKSNNLYHLGMEIEGAILAGDRARTKALISDIPKGDHLWDGVLRASTAANSLSLTKKAVRKGATAITDELKFLKRSKRQNEKRSRIIAYLESQRPSVLRVRPYAEENPRDYVKRIVMEMYPILSADDIKSICAEIKREWPQENIIYRTCPTSASREIRLIMEDLGLMY